MWCGQESREGVRVSGVGVSRSDESIAQPLPNSTRATTQPQEYDRDRAEALGRRLKRALKKRQLDEAPSLDRFDVAWTEAIAEARAERAGSNSGGGSADEASAGGARGNNGLGRGGRRGKSKGRHSYSATVSILQNGGVAVSASKSPFGVGEASLPHLPRISASHRGW